MLAEELGDEELGVCALSFLLGAANMDGDLESGHQHGREALRRWPVRARLYQLATTHELMSLNEYWRGEYESAEARSRQAYELGHEVQSIGPVINGGAQLGLSLCGLGRHEEALEVFERVIAEGRELEGQPRFTSRATNMCAGVLHELLDIDAARAKNEEAIALGERAGFPGAIVSGKIDLLLSDLALGEFGRAEAALPELQEAAEATKGWHQWLWVTRLARARAEVAVASGRYDEAAQLARGAIAVSERFHRPKYTVASRLVLGSALRKTGRSREAVETLERALADAERLRHPPTLWRAAAGLAEALYATGDDAGAERASGRARAEIDAFAAGLSETHRQRFLASPQLGHQYTFAR